MRDVAKRAGVSVGTVSNYLNGTAVVANDTATRIRAAIDELGYQVNMSARSLRMNRTQSVGLILPNISNPYFAEIARSIEHALWQRGYQTLLTNSDEDPERELAHIEHLVQRRVDGILTSHSTDPSTLRDVARRMQIPLVCVDRAIPNQHSVTTDNELGGRLVAQHLVGLGHRDVAVLAGATHIDNVRQRIAGFRNELARLGVQLEARRVLSGPQALELGFRVRELLDEPSPPTAVFATNDIVAIGAWRSLLACGRMVPDDVSLVGFDDITMSRLTVPPLTTVAQDEAGVGEGAVSVLLRLMRGERLPASITAIEPRLVVRESTAAPGGRA